MMIEQNILIEELVIAALKEVIARLENVDNMTGKSECVNIIFALKNKMVAHEKNLVGYKNDLQHKRNLLADIEKMRWDMVFNKSLDKP